MTFSRKWLTAALSAATLAVVGVGAAVATSESPAITEHAQVEDETNESADDAAEGEDTPIFDNDALATASDKALAWLDAEHGVTGTVTDTEVGDEESHYEIEVTLEDGRQVDVQLTEDFEVVGLD